MKVVQIILLTLLFCSCVNYDEIYIDECEYIKTTNESINGPIAALTHKGNCDNPVHKIDTVFIIDTVYVQR